MLFKRIFMLVLVLTLIIPLVACTESNTEKKTTQVMATNEKELTPRNTDFELIDTVDTPEAVSSASYQFTSASWHTASNEGIVHFTGVIRDEAGNLVNGYSVLADNGSYKVLSHPTGASHHYPETGDGAWDVVLYNPAVANGWWTLTVVKYECPDFDNGFNAQCQQYTRLSEDMQVEVNFPDTAIVNVDWVCHQDCNQGLYVDAYRAP